MSSGILLVDAQQAAGVVGVVGIEERRHLMLDVALVEVNPTDGRGRGLLDVEEVELVRHPISVARDIDVVKLRLEVEIPKGHRELDGGVLEPRLRLDPYVRELALVSAREILAEQAVVIVEPHAVAAKAQRGDGIHEARRQAPEPAVSERGLGLDVLDLLERGPIGPENALGLVKKPEVYEVGAKQTTDEKLSG